MAHRLESISSWSRTRASRRASRRARRSASACASVAVLLLAAPRVARRDSCRSVPAAAIGAAAGAEGRSVAAAGAPGMAQQRPVGRAGRGHVARAVFGCLSWAFAMSRAVGREPGRRFCRKPAADAELEGHDASEPAGASDRADDGGRRHSQSSRGAARFEVASAALGGYRPRARQPPTRARVTARARAATAAVAGWDSMAVRKGGAFGGDGGG
eukprot:52200-Prymnesium_polylepis.1